MFLTKVWLSKTWCDRMMRRAEALMGDPKDSSETSDPAKALKKQPEAVRYDYSPKEPWDISEHTTQ